MESNVLQEVLYQKASSWPLSWVPQVVKKKKEKKKACDSGEVDSTV